MEARSGHNENLPMACPICESLKREHNVLCEIEARVTLRQRAATVSGRGLDVDGAHHADEVVLDSRRRQIKIAAKLDQHRRSEHPPFSEIA